MGRHSGPEEAGAVGVQELLRRSGVGHTTRPGSPGALTRRGRHFATEGAAPAAGQAGESVAEQVDESVAEQVPAQADGSVAEQVPELAAQDVATRETERIVPLDTATAVLPHLPFAPEPEQAAVAAAGTEPTAEAPPSAKSPTSSAVSSAVSSPLSGKGGTHADLALLRSDSALRARCAAAVVIPFVLYTLVLVVTGHLDVFLLWVWIPTVLAGVLIGTFLDLAHRRIARS